MLTWTQARQCVCVQTRELSSPLTSQTASSMAAASARHKGVHHLSRTAAESDTHGWVESISNLTETTPATELMLADADAAPGKVGCMLRALPTESGVCVGWPCRLCSKSSSMQSVSSCAVDVYALLGLARAWGALGD